MCVRADRIGYTTREAPTRPRVKRVAGGHNSLVGKVAYSELPHRCGAGSGPAIDTSPELIVSDIEAVPIRARV